MSFNYSLVGPYSTLGNLGIGVFMARSAQVWLAWGHGCDLFIYLLEYGCGLINGT